MGGGGGEGRRNCMYAGHGFWSGAYHLNSSSLRDRGLRDQVTGSEGSSAYLVYVHTVREHLIGGSGALASSYRYSIVYTWHLVFMCIIILFVNCSDAWESWRLGD